MKSVSQIFGSEAKVKIMRLFIFNPGHIFTLLQVAKRTKERLERVRKEVRSLSKAGLVRPKGKGFALDPSYPYLIPIENFLVDATPLTGKDIVKKISRSGNIKFILISGVFMHDKDSRVDILVVGDRLKHSKLVSAISSIEAELGKELRYTSFETADFEYRSSIYDKLIRDILEGTHEKILNKLGI